MDTSVRRDAMPLRSANTRRGRNCHARSAAEPDWSRISEAGVSPEQASQEIAGWQQKLRQAKDQAKSTASSAADKAASGVSKAALWSFLALLLSAIAAALGGLVGAPKGRTSLVSTQTPEPYAGDFDVVRGEKLHAPLTSRS